MIPYQTQPCEAPFICGNAIVAVASRAFVMKICAVSVRFLQGSSVEAHHELGGQVRSKVRGGEEVTTVTRR